MTREEAIEVINKHYPSSSTGEYEDLRKALNMAIEALTKWETLIEYTGWLEEQLESHGCAYICDEMSDSEEEWELCKTNCQFCRPSACCFNRLFQLKRRK